MSVTKNTLNPVIRALIWLERIPGQFPSSRGDKMYYCYGKGWVRNVPCQYCAKIGYLNKIIKYEEKP